MIFEGIITALITPFKNNKIDYDSLKNLINKQIESKIDGIIIGGSTGEGGSLSDEEYYELIKKSTLFADKKISVIAGISSSNTMFTKNKIEKLSSMNIDGLMCTAPHYVRPEQDGIIKHYQEINFISKFPIMAYTHPIRTACDFSDETLIEISKLDKIIALKDASSDIAKPLRFFSNISDQSVNSNFKFLTGDDINILAYNANGGSGCVSVFSNIFPKILKNIHDIAKTDMNKSLEIHRNIIPFLSELFTKSNPIGIKYALSRIGLCKNELRLPLMSSYSQGYKKIDKQIEFLTGLENEL